MCVGCSTPVGCLGRCWRRRGRGGQSLLAKDLAAKTRAVELALARGANILDAVMSRKHDRETELDSRCRDRYVAQHEVPARARPRTRTPPPRRRFLHPACLFCLLLAGIVL